MRPAILLPLLALSGELVSACGGGTHPAPKTATAALGRSPAASRTIAKPQALAFVRAVNLTAADVPGFTASSAREHETIHEKRLEQQLLRCVGPVGSPSDVAEQGSPSFELKRGIVQLTVSSQVSVAQNTGAAARELAAIRSRHVEECLSHYVGLLLKSQQYPGGATVGPIAITSGTPPASGTAGGFGWRITAPLSVRAIGVSLYLDILGFVDGPSTVTLFSSGALRPFPAQAQQRLFSLLLSRAKAHSL